jgi:hypothetical protein
MDPIAIFAASAVVGGGARERMSELDPRVQFDEARVYGRGESGHLDPEELGGSLEKDSVAERLGSGEQDEQSSLRGECVESLRVRLLDLSSYTFACRHAEPASEVGDV